MGVHEGPLLDVECVADTAWPGPSDTDLDVKAIFRAFLDDKIVSSAFEMAAERDCLAPVIREQNHCLMSAHGPSISTIHGASHTASSQQSLLKPKRSNKMRRLHRNVGPVRRRITNDTYLRRLYMPPDSVICLFPSLSSKLLEMTALRSEQAHCKPRYLSQDIVMTDATGRSWPVTCDCKLSSSGILHCRLIGGWSRFCRDNNVAVQDEVVLVRGCGRSADVTVHVDRRRE
jgi:hypothetical protein